MAQILNVTLPGGWREPLSVTPEADISRWGRMGDWHLNDNDPYFVWTLEATYRRSDFETQGDLRFDDVYAFFLVVKGFGFLVDDIFDNTAVSRHGSGIIRQENGAWRLFKRYSLLGLTYDHPITRPKNDVELSAGVLDDLGVVTGISSAGTWTGGFKRPMIFAENGLKISRNNAGIVDAINIRLEEQIEI